MRFLDIKTDYPFKKVFEDNESKEILVSFLNSICEFKIEDLCSIHIFKKELKECKTIQDRWIYFIKDTKKLDYVSKNLDDKIKKALKRNEENLAKEELELQYKRKEFILIQKGAIKKAKKDGLKEGIEKGTKESKKSLKIDIAKNLIDILNDETIP